MKKALRNYLNIDIRKKNLKQLCEGEFTNLKWTKWFSNIFIKITQLVDVDI